MKSTPDKLTAAQMMSYVLKAMLQYPNNQNDKPLPMVYPFILYHGKTKFTHALDFLDLVDATQQDIDKYLRGNLQLIDLTTMSDETLISQPEILLSLPFLILKHIKDDDMLDSLTSPENIDRIIRLFRQYVEIAGIENMTLALRYACTAGKIEDKDKLAQFLHEVKPKLGENMMTFREAAVQEGIEEGIEQGREEGMKHGENRLAQRMLAKYKPEIVAQLLEWPLSKVMTLVKTEEVET